ncbi:MAG: hypothetical protein KBT57_07700 [bacterium]|nr:hypothetical protein [Candidatus Limimorpha equi]
MKKFVLLFCVSLVFSACDITSNPDSIEGTIEKDTISTVSDMSSEKPIEDVDSDKGYTSEENQCFVYGVSNYKLYKPSRDESNNGVTFEYRGRNLKIVMFEYQIGLFAQLIDEYGDRTNIGYDDILAVVESDYDFDEYYSDWEYAIAQYDIDSDGKDEIIIASRINEGMSTPTGIFIYRIKDGKSWSLKAPQTWGDMKVKFVNNHIRVEPNHYGFTYDWAFENDEFVDLGEY